MNEPATLSNTQPLYVSRGGEQVYQPPFQSQNVHLYGFVFPLDEPKASQRLLDKCLNAPAKGAVDYRLAAPLVLATFAHMGPLSSLDAPDRDKGFFEYDEAALWLLTMAMKPANEAAGNARPRVERLAWFIPYMFAELSQAVCCGREIYGYPKAYGWVQMPQNTPSSTRNADNFSLETVVLPQFSAQTRARRQSLFSVRRVNGNKDEGFAKEWMDAREALAEMLRLLRFESGVPVPDFDFLLQLADFGLHSEALMVYLKQFRDVSDGTRACYQAIVEARGKIENVRRIGLLSGDYRLQIEHADSHPIGDDLGLPISSDALLSFSIEFDLGIETGNEVWKADAQA